MPISFKILGCCAFLAFLFGCTTDRSVELSQTSKSALDLLAEKFISERHPRELVHLETRTVQPTLVASSPDFKIAIAQSSETIAFDLNQRRPLKRWPGAHSRWQFSENSKRLLRIDGDTVSVLACDTLATLRSWKAAPILPSANEPILSLIACISPDGSRVAVSNRNHCFSGDLDAEIIVFDSISGEICAALKDSFSSSEAKTYISWEFRFASTSDRLLLTRRAYPDSISALIDIDTQTVLREFDNGKAFRVASDAGLIAAAEIAKRGSMTLLKSNPSEIEIVDSNSGMLLQQIPIDGAIRAFDIAASGREIIVSVQQPGAKMPPKQEGIEADTSGRLTVLHRFDASTGERLSETSGFTLPVCDIFYGKTLNDCLVAMEYPAGIDDDLDIKWQWIATPSGKALSDDGGIGHLRVQAPHRGLAVSWDQEQFMDDGMGLFALPDGKRLWSAKPLPRYAPETAFSNDGKLCWFDDTLTKLAGGDQRRWLDYSDLQFLRDDHSVFARRATHLVIGSVVDGKAIWRRGLGGGLSVRQAICTENGQLIAVAATINPLTPTGRLLVINRSDEDHPHWIECDARRICFPAGGNTLIAVTQDKVLELTLPDLRIVREVTVQNIDPQEIVCTRDGEVVFIAGQSVVPPSLFRGTRQDGYLLRVDLASGQSQAVWQSDTAITSVAISKDDNRVCACNRASDDRGGEIWAWNLNDNIQATDWSRPLTIDGHDSTVNDVAMHPDGKILLAAGNDGAKIWDISPTGFRNDEKSDARNLLFPDQVRLVEQGSLWQNSLTPITDARVALFQRPTDSRLQSEAEQFNPQSAWPLVLVDDVPKVHRRGYVSELDRWLDGAGERIRISVQDWNQSSLIKLLDQYDLGPRSQDGKLRLAYKKHGPERQHVLLDSQWRQLHAFPAVEHANHATLSPSGKYVALSLPQSKSQRTDSQLAIELWDTQAGISVWQAHVPGMHVSSLEIGAGDRVLKIDDNGRQIITLDMTTGNELARYRREITTSIISQLSPEGSCVAVSRRSDTFITLFDPTTFTKQSDFETAFPIQWMRWNPTGTQLLVGQEYGEGLTLVLCWDVANSAILWSTHIPAVVEIEFDQLAKRMLLRGNVFSNYSLLMNANSGAIEVVFMPTTNSDSQQLVLSQKGDIVHQTDIGGPVVWPVPSDLKAERR